MRSGFTLLACALVCMHCFTLRMCMRQDKEHLMRSGAPLLVVMVLRHYADQVHPPLKKKVSTSPTRPGTASAGPQVMDAWIHPRARARTGAPALLGQRG
jgi:hypothetical protein